MLHHQSTNECKLWTFIELEGDELLKVELALRNPSVKLVGAPLPFAPVPVNVEPFIYESSPRKSGAVGSRARLAGTLYWKMGTKGQAVRISIVRVPGVHGLSNFS